MKQHLHTPARSGFHIYPHIFIAALCVTIAVILVSPCVSHAAAHTITKSEWASFIGQNAALHAADTRLNQAYKRLMAALPPAEKTALLHAQRAWISTRNTNAFKLHPKGSSEYLHFLAEATAKREQELRAQYAAPGANAKPEAKANAEAKAKPEVKPKAEASQTPTPAAPVTLVKKAPQAARAQTKPAATASPEETAATRRETPPAAAEKPNHIAAAPEKHAAPQPKLQAKTEPAKPKATDLTITVQPKRPAVITVASRIDMTPPRFYRSYNTLAQKFKTAAFPASPTNVTGNGKSRTEHYQVQNGISIQFKYTQGVFDKPEIITFLGRQFVTGTTRHRDDIAYSLVTLLKSLNENSQKNDADKDAEIFGFMRSINQAFTTDTSRVWRNNGLVYVITYMKKTDLFAMAVSVDESRR